MTAWSPFPSGALDFPILRLNNFPYLQIALFLSSSLLFSSFREKKKKRESVVVVVTVPCFSFFFYFESAWKNGRLEFFGGKCVFFCDLIIGNVDWKKRKEMCFEYLKEGCCSGDDLSFLINKSAARGWAGRLSIHLSYCNFFLIINNPLISFLFSSFIFSIRYLVYISNRTYPCCPIQRACDKFSLKGKWLKYPYFMAIVALFKSVNLLNG